MVVEDGIDDGIDDGQDSAHLSIGEAVFGVRRREAGGGEKGVVLAWWHVELLGEEGDHLRLCPDRPVSMNERCRVDTSVRLAGSSWECRRGCSQVRSRSPNAASGAGSSASGLMCGRYPAAQAQAITPQVVVFTT